MPKKAILAGAAGALALSTVAIAGLTQPAPVQVNLDGGGGFAQGDQLTARNDADPDVFIGCGTRTFDDGAGFTFRSGFCQAEDNEGDRVVCMTQNEVLLDAMRATSDYAFITFSFVDDGAGGFECTRVGHSTQSFYHPAQALTQGDLDALADSIVSRLADD